MNVPVFRMMAWSGILLLIIGLVATVTMERWVGSLGMAIFLAISVAFVLQRKRLPSIFSFLVVLASILNAGGWVWDLFHSINWYDELTHVFTTATVSAALAFVMFFSQRASFKQHGVIFAFAVTSVGLSLGALWELFEWRVGALGSFHDTLMDLLMDLVGALVAGLLTSYALRHSHELDSTSHATAQ